MRKFRTSKQPLPTDKNLPPQPTTPTWGSAPHTPSTNLSSILASDPKKKAHHDPNISASTQPKPRQIFPPYRLENITFKTPILKAHFDQEHTGLGLDYALRLINEAVHSIPEARLHRTRNSGRSRYNVIQSYKMVDAGGISGVEIRAVIHSTTNPPPGWIEKGPDFTHYTVNFRFRPKYPCEVGYSRAAPIFITKRDEFGQGCRSRLVCVAPMVDGDDVAGYSEQREWVKKKYAEMQLELRGFGVVYTGVRRGPGLRAG